jgi:hypothetical protein
MVWEVIMASVLGKLPQDVRVFTYAADVLVLARTRREACAVSQTLQAAFGQHPAGPFSFSRHEIRRACDGFEFLKYRFRWRRGAPRVEPSHSSLRRFKAKRYLKILQDIEEQRPLDGTRDYVRSWFAQTAPSSGDDLTTAHWAGLRQLVDSHLDRLEVSLRVYGHIPDGPRPIAELRDAVAPWMAAEFRRRVYAD